jgi:hypothetical protein
VSVPKFVLHLGRADGTGPTRILTTVCGEDVAGGSAESITPQYFIVLFMGHSHITGEDHETFRACLPSDSFGRHPPWGTYP